jgi:hypothetical protein
MAHDDDQITAPSCERNDRKEVDEAIPKSMGHADEVNVKMVKEETAVMMDQMRRKALLL